TQVEVDISKQVICSDCRGSGAKSEDDVITCDACGGRGVKVVKQMLGPGIFQQIHSTGRKVLRANEQLTVIIERGMKDGNTVVFEKESDEAPDTIPGDIIFKIKTLPHSMFERNGDNLYKKETISLIDALTGFERNFTHLDGRTVTIKRDTVTQPNFVQVIKDEGMPRHRTQLKGDLYVEYTVVFPSVIDDATKEGLKKLFPNMGGVS
ncbi:25916_t:CDS:2, partial [Racocetra persica]